MLHINKCIYIYVYINIKRQIYILSPAPVYGNVPSFSHLAMKAVNETPPGYGDKWWEKKQRVVWKLMENQDLYNWNEIN